MSQRALPIPPPDIETLIVEVRGHKVILDSDLAWIYGVSTKALNQAFKRNLERFPSDFAFPLMPRELRCFMSQFVTSNMKRGGRRYLPRAFTEHGAMMAANILNSPRAIEMSVYVIRAFVKMRGEFGRTQDMVRRLAEIEKTLIGHDSALRDLYNKMRPLLLSPEPKRREIGFHVKPDESSKAKGKRM